MTIFYADKATDQGHAMRQRGLAIKKLQLSHCGVEPGFFKQRGTASVDEALLHSHRKLGYAYSMVTVTDIHWTEEELAEPKRRTFHP